MTPAESTTPGLTKAELKKLAVLAVTALVVTLIVYSQSPVAQDPTYHQFADDRTFLNIPNFWNVISNVPFLAAGAYGLVVTFFNPQSSQLVLEKGAWGTLFAGVFLTGIGSATSITGICSKRSKRLV